MKATCGDAQGLMKIRQVKSAKADMSIAESVISRAADLKERSNLDGSSMSSREGD